MQDIVGIRTLVRYLLGDSEAIRTLASTRHTLWLGLLFVLSAGFAREYDGADLLHEPWHLFLPLGASLLSSLVLFVLISLPAALRDDPDEPFGSRYLSFLGLFWMTAPLAWLYAIPYEHLLGPANATRMNLLTLGVVSLWRVVLMIRVAMVLYGYSRAAALYLVFLFADAVALTALNFLPIPIIDVMGGFRTPRERVVQGVALDVLLAGGCSLPIWIVGAIGVLIWARPAWKIEPRPAAPSWLLILLAGASLAVWAPILPLTQPAQQRRAHVERLFAQGRIPEALAEMSAWERPDYPPGWEPPPTVFRQKAPGEGEWIQVLRELSRGNSAPWVCEAYMDKSFIFLTNYYAPHIERWEEVPELVARIPGGKDLPRRLREDGQKEKADWLEGKR
jgi:hypothetical protein